MFLLLFSDALSLSSQGNLTYLSRSSSSKFIFILSPQNLAEKLKPDYKRVGVTCPSELSDNNGNTLVNKILTETSVVI